MNDSLREGLLMAFPETAAMEPSPKEMMYILLAFGMQWDKNNGITQPDGYWEALIEQANEMPDGS